MLQTQTSPEPVPDPEPDDPEPDEPESDPEEPEPVESAPDPEPIAPVFEPGDPATMTVDGPDEPTGTAVATGATPAPPGTTIVAVITLEDVSLTSVGGIAGEGRHSLGLLKGGELLGDRGDDCLCDGLGGEAGVDSGYAGAVVGNRAGDVCTDGTDAGTPSAVAELPLEVVGIWDCVSECG